MVLHRQFLLKSFVVFVFLILYFLIATSVFAQTATNEWSNRLGGIYTDDVQSVTVDSAGNIIVTGSLTGDADLNGNGVATDGGAESANEYTWDVAFVAKYDSSGTHLWSKRLPGLFNGIGNSVTVDSSDNVIVVGTVGGDADLNGNGTTTDGGTEDATGYGNDDIFISVFNSAGTYQWSKRLGGVAVGGDEGVYVISDSSDNIIVTGSVRGDADLNGNGVATDGGAEDATGYGSVDAFISVFNSAGTYQWSTRLGGASFDGGTSLAITSTDDIIITGYVNGDADLNGNGVATDGGAEDATGYNSTDAFISAFNSAGTYQWSKRLGGTGYDLAWSNAVLSSDNIVITGVVTGSADLNGDRDSSDGGAEDATSYGSADVFISVFNSAGEYQWSKRLGSINYDEGRGVVTDAADNVIVTGYIEGNADLNGDSDSTDGGAEDATGYGNEDIFLSVFNADGDFQLSKRLGGSSDDRGASVSTNSLDDIIVAGYAIGDADLNGDGDATDGGAEDATDYGNEDIFLSAFSTNYDAVAPAISLNTITSATNPILTGTATDADGTVSSVEFQANSTAGSWTACTAIDSAFDEAIEAFTCTLGSFGSGTHTIYTRATDDNLNTTTDGSEVSGSFTIASSGGGGGGGGSTAPQCEAFTLSDNTLSWETKSGSDLEITQNGSEIFSTEDDDVVDGGNYDLSIAPVAGSVFELTVSKGTKSDSCTINVNSTGTAATPTAPTTPTTPIPTPVNTFFFTRDLNLGYEGNDVLQLQKFLNTKGYAISATGVGSMGNETTYFGLKTQAALARFQGTNGISPAVGFFGPLTRAQVNAMMGNTVSMTPTTPTNNNAVLISLLTAQLVELQKQLVALLAARAAQTYIPPTSTYVAPTASAPEPTYIPRDTSFAPKYIYITRELSVGSEGTDVKWLQQFLNGQGHVIAYSGTGSPGNETETFGPATETALKAYQLANLLNPTGVTDAVTRAKMSAH